MTLDWKILKLLDNPIANANELSAITDIQFMSLQAGKQKSTNFSV